MPNNIMKFDGKIINPGDSSYDEARTIWNEMFDKRPSIILQCKNTDDVVRAVQFGRKNNLLTAVRGGGHNSAGNSVCDDGLVIDLSDISEVKVNPSDSTVEVGGGALIGQVDHATQEYGLAVSAGIVSHTGVGGLALGGGFGWISRKHGLSVDNLQSVEMVLADGRVVNASADENEDLYWAVRGGGGNFGIVTKFKFKAAKIGNEVLSGPIVKKFENIKEYIRFHRDFVRTLPDEMTVWMVIRKAPPLPFLPEQHHGKLVILLPFTYLGDEGEGHRLIQPIRDFGETLGDGSSMHKWLDWQSAFDELNAHGARNYWKSHHLTGLDDEFIDIIEEFALKLPSDECDIFIPHMEGAPSRIPSNATAFPHRSTPFLLNIHTRWRNKSDDEKAIQWAKDLHKAAEPFSQGVYVNFLSQEGDDRVKQAYTAEVWSRLVECKKKYDPTNFFRMNQNISPES